LKGMQVLARCNQNIDLEMFAPDPFQQIGLGFDGREYGEFFILITPAGAPNAKNKDGKEKKGSQINHDEIPEE
ncbi:MAG: hypothetical protein AB7F20_00735, partial [Geoalkalibacter sp.]|uniref:hypothetical protein n=1 Tax=Geoalkalibacter sp. TaxID=3041440 RepID=UPI003D12EDB4